MRRPVSLLSYFMFAPPSALYRFVIAWTGRSLPARAARVVLVRSASGSTSVDAHHCPPLTGLGPGNLTGKVAGTIGLPGLSHCGVGAGYGCDELMRGRRLARRASENYVRRRRWPQNGAAAGPVSWVGRPSADLSHRAQFPVRAGATLYYLVPHQTGGLPAQALPVEGVDRDRATGVTPGRISWQCTKSWKTSRDPDFASKMAASWISTTIHHLRQAACQARSVATRKGCYLANLLSRGTSAGISRASRTRRGSTGGRPCRR
jgi:hypothetical protein